MPGRVPRVRCQIASSPLAESNFEYPRRRETTQAREAHACPRASEEIHRPEAQTRGRSGMRLRTPRLRFGLVSANPQQLVNPLVAKRVGDEGGAGEVVAVAVAARNGDGDCA